MKKIKQLKPSDCVWLIYLYYINLLGAEKSVPAAGQRREDRGREGATGSQVSATGFQF